METEFKLEFEISKARNAGWISTEHHYTYPDGMYLLRLLKEKFGDDFSFENNYIRPNRYDGISQIEFRFTPDELLSCPPALFKLFEHKFYHRVKVSVDLIPDFSELQIELEKPSYAGNEHDVCLKFKILEDLFLDTWIYNDCPEIWYKMKKIKKFKPHTLVKEHVSLIDRIKHWWHQEDSNDK